MGKRLLILTGIIALLCFFRQETRAQPGPSRPNIVFILADDLGWGELGCYGNTFNETPNLDKLAAGGIRFTQAYAAAPVCSPTRASIMTGEYPARVGITDFLAPKSVEFLDPGKYTTVNEALSRAGYHTGIIGKWHLDTHFRNEKGGPGNFRFDEVIASETKYIAGGDYFYPYDKIGTITTGPPDEYLTDRQSEEAVRFIGRNKNQPFFLYLSYYAVHTVLDAPQGLVEKYKKKFDEKYGAGKAEKIYGPQNKRHQANHKDNPWLAAMLERIDAGVGAVMEALKQNGLDRNTLVIFFSDNGGAHGVANNGGLRGGKTWLYEGGIREPLVMRWPGAIKAGTVTEVPVCSVDFYPTFVEIAHAPAPQAQLMDGVSILPLIRKGTPPGRRDLFWYYPSPTAGWKKRMCAAVREGDYKLLHFFADGHTELYNLKDDPHEKTNLAFRMPEKAKALENKLETWQKSVKAPKPAL